MSRKRTVIALAVVLMCLIAAGSSVLVRLTFFGPTTITALFTTTTAVYPGDEVRVSGVTVGHIAAIEPDGPQSRIVMKVDRGVSIPADAKAVIVSYNLVAARYVQLTPSYRASGPTMHDGAVIPIDRTAVPVEWDEVKAQLTRLSTDLGPSSDVSTPSMSRLIDSAANALDGNGDKLRQMLAQLSGVGRILADGSGNIVDIIEHLQTFVTTLRDSNEQIVQFQDRLATLSSVLDGSRSDLDAALKNLSIAVGDVHRFVAKYRDKTSEQIQRLGDVTQNLVDHSTDLEQVLHVAPNSFANAYNMYNPDTGEFAGAAVINMFSNPVQFICAQIGAIENATASETAKLCGQYLGPALRLLNFNNVPIPVNPLIAKSASPDNLVYTDPNLAPGEAGPNPPPPDTPPAVSAYTEPASPSTLPEMLLPAQQPEPQPTEGNPPP
ncbi:MAG: phospholipid/cholesterol/gamma-HCH transport system substrate-binding protein [Mycobacterium sp.]|nr:phospholipid/cholesterol/gamma-HCH transport system substrate-binding protein [Mycobacterium sp.]